MSRIESPHTPLRIRYSTYWIVLDALIDSKPEYMRMVAMSMATKPQI